MDEVRLLIVIFCYCVAFSKDVLCQNTDDTDGDGGKLAVRYETTIEKVPYQAFLLLQNGNNYYQCGGSIISERFILTAAHCADSVTKAVVQVGSTNVDTGGQMYEAALVVKHPQYNAENYDYDVALIRLIKRITINDKSTKIIKLPESGTVVQPNTTIRISGWGDTRMNRNISPTLMAVEIPTMPKADCEKAFSPITDRQFCTGVSEGGKVSCQGDSGGPAVDTSNGLQVGIVSIGYGCSGPGSPGVYTEVSGVRDWIKHISGV